MLVEAVMGERALGPFLEAVEGLLKSFLEVRWARPRPSPGPEPPSSNARLVAAFARRGGMGVRSGVQD